ncbi:MAG: sugar phosphate isomerase/epimerase [Victivallales bacterium]|nr:sugar phosphate isomerase/epimerase [Victivallales bacterium]
MNAPLFILPPWKLVADEYLAHIAREVLDHGYNHLVFSCGLAMRCVNEPDLIKRLHKIQDDLHVTLGAMHAPFGYELDLDVVAPDIRKKMLEIQLGALRVAGDFGCKTFTIHVGAHEYIAHGVPIDQLISLAHETLEVLIPEAEKQGVVIAVENSFEPPNSARVVREVIKPFLSSPSCGVCYDTGHANCMFSAPWKKWENYPAYQHRNWREGFVTEDDSLEVLAPYIVTCHIHDNDGYGDLHGMPGDGTIDWPVMMQKLRACPRMMEYQSEICFDDGDNWAGHLLAPAGGYSIKRLCDTFHNLLGFPKDLS